MPWSLWASLSMSLSGAGFEYCDTRYRDGGENCRSLEICFENIAIWISCSTFYGYEHRCLVSGTLWFSCLKISISNKHYLREMVTAISAFAVVTLLPEVPSQPSLSTFLEQICAICKIYSCDSNGSFTFRRHLWYHASKNEEYWECMDGNRLGAKSVAVVWPCETWTSSTGDDVY